LNPVGMLHRGNHPGLESGGAIRGIWKLLFFVAALCVLAAGILSLVCILFSFTWAPFTFMSEIFLVMFGLLMCVLDFPAPNHVMEDVHNYIFKFALFLTRFTGRGLWYCFLGTLVWLGLLEQDRGWLVGVLGLLLGLYVLCLGITAIIYGLLLSTKLNKVRTRILEQGGPPACPPGGLSKTAFGDFCSHVEQTTRFSDDELSYVLNGLSFTPANGEVLTQQEYKFWLSHGRMPIL